DCSALRRTVPHGLADKRREAERATLVPPKCVVNTRLLLPMTPAMLRFVNKKPGRNWLFNRPAVSYNRRMVEHCIGPTWRGSPDDGHADIRSIEARASATADPARVPVGGAGTPGQLAGGHRHGRPALGRHGR